MSNKKYFLALGLIILIVSIFSLANSPNGATVISNSQQHNLLGGCDIDCGKSGWRLLHTYSNS